MPIIKKKPKRAVTAPVNDRAVTAPPPEVLSDESEWSDSEEETEKLRKELTEEKTMTRGLTRRNTELQREKETFQMRLAELEEDNKEIATLREENRKLKNRLEEREAELEKHAPVALNGRVSKLETCMSFLLFYLFILPLLSKLILPALFLGDWDGNFDSFTSIKQFFSNHSHPNSTSSPFDFAFGENTAVSIS